MLCGLISLVGLLLVAFPKMDQPWLDALENIAPNVQEAFLTPGERATRIDSLESVAQASAELTRLRALEQDVRWGTKEMDADKQERLRQYLAGRSEISAGDQLVLQALRAKARERQRYALGIPLLILGAGAIAVLARRQTRNRDIA
jgi:zinc/manganese transport system permease protein